MHRNGGGVGSRDPGQMSGRRLLVWDAPNMDMCLGEVIGQKTTAETRPNLEAVRLWMAQRCPPGDVLEVCIFLNVPVGLERQMAAWVVSLRHQGFSVFAKPKQHRNDDIDDDILRHLERRFAHGGLRQLTVASHDGRAFAAALNRYAEAGVQVEVVGYREKDTFAAAHELLTFVDLEDVPGAFVRPLSRTNLFDLPSGGRWFDPFPPEAGIPPRGPSAPPLEDVVPDREAVLELLRTRVTASVQAGQRGITVGEAGEFLRERFPAFALSEVGFHSVSELLDALCAEPGFALVRDGERHLLTTRGLELEPPAALKEPEPADAPETTPPDQPQQLNHPIYRAFGGGSTIPRGGDLGSGEPTLPPPVALRDTGS